MARRRRKPPGRSQINFDISIAGVDHMRNLLKEMPQTLRNGIVVPIARTLSSQGAKWARDELRRALPKRARHEKRWEDRPTGALANSLGQKVLPLGRMKNKNVVFGIFGARTRLQFRMTKTVARRVANVRLHGLDIWDAMRSPNYHSVSRPIAPARYIHLVEYGHQKGRGPVKADPYPFIRPTRQRLQTVMPTIIRERWRTLYPQQIAKLKRRYVRQADITRQTQAFQRRSSGGY